MTLEKAKIKLENLIPSTSYETNKLEAMAVLGADVALKFYDYPVQVGYTGWIDIDGYQLFFSPTATAIL